MQSPPPTHLVRITAADDRRDRVGIGKALGVANGAGSGRIQPIDATLTWCSADRVHYRLVLLRGQRGHQLFGASAGIV